MIWNSYDRRDLRYYLLGDVPGRYLHRHQPLSTNKKTTLMPFPARFISRDADRFRYMKNEFAAECLSDIAAALVEIYQTKSSCTIFIEIDGMMDNLIHINLGSDTEPVQLQEYIHELAHITMGIKHKINADQEELARKWPEFAQKRPRFPRKASAARKKKGPPIGLFARLRLFFGGFPRIR
jgi:hypothetical protein